MPRSVPAREGTYRDFPGRRWLGVGLRAAHLVGVTGLGGSLLANSPLLPGFALLLLGSGVTMILLDAWSLPHYRREFAGLAMLIKLPLVAWLLLDPWARPYLFWGLLVFSAVVAHAPARWRHRRWRRPAAVAQAALPSPPHVSPAPEKLPHD